MPSTWLTRRSRTPWTPPVETVAACVGAVEDVIVAPEGLESWFETFRLLQAASIWANHGAWIREARPEFGPGVKERFEWAEALDARDVDAAKKHCESIRARIVQVTGRGRHTVPAHLAPRRACERIRRWTTSRSATATRPCTCLCIAGLGGLPQISLPMAELGGLPLGLSLNGPRGADMQLLGLARKLMPKGPD